MVRAILVFLERKQMNSHVGVPNLYCTSLVRATKSCNTAAIGGPLHEIDLLFACNDLGAMLSAIGIPDMD